MIGGRAAADGPWEWVSASTCVLRRKYFWFWSSKNKNAFPSLAFCPSAFCPSCEIPEGLDTTRQNGSSPKRSRGVALRRHGSFCKGAAARQPKMR